VNLPNTATGLALHRNQGLIAASPRDGKVLRIDNAGKVSTILERSEDLPHPVDVGVGADSDTVLVADNVADVLMATSTTGGAPLEYRRFPGNESDRQDMSIGATRDGYVILGTNGDEGVFRFSGVDSLSAKEPILPGAGGVAADHATSMWAATQKRNEIYVFEGEEPSHKFVLPEGKQFYRQGLMSFSGPGTLVVAVQDADTETDNAWLMQLQAEADQDRITNLFKWNRERMVDFVAGPRMFWERHEPNEYQSLY
jgi:hypothetical protein